MPDDRSGTLTGQKLGTYQLTEKIGQGGMGAVYKARDLSLDRTVAVKVLPAAMAADKTYVQRFVREARAIARLSHRNLVHIYHVGQRDGLYYFAMEFISGRTLRQHLAAAGPLTIEEFLRIAGQVLSALGRIHAAGVTHRDVKSANVIIEEGTGRAVLTDFGLAKEQEAGAGGAEGLTRAGVLLGTPEYMSPEQAEGRAADARSDLYAFGILAYEMLSGKVPFRGASALAVLRKHAEEPPPPLSAARPGLPPALEAVVARALAKRPDERYASAAELAGDLVRVGHTAELAELASSGLDATARTIVGGPLAGAAAVPASASVLPTSPTVTVAPPPAAGVGPRRGLAIAAAAAAAVLLLVLGLVLAVRGCRRGQGGGGGKDGSGTVVIPPVAPPPKVEPVTWDLVLPDKTRRRIRLLGWEGSAARVLDLSDNREKVVEMAPGMALELPAREAPAGGQR
ncbi:MAG TPA: serine/threonine-protein kinase [Planctomycetota bacterium]|nr:serine/threonine-protein kinase [Planctomycetota bacterium]